MDQKRTTYELHQDKWGTYHGRTWYNLDLTEWTCMRKKYITTKCHAHVRLYTYTWAVQMKVVSIPSPYEPSMLGSPNELDTALLWNRRGKRSGWPRCPGISCACVEFQMGMLEELHVAMKNGRLRDFRNPPVLKHGWKTLKHPQTKWIMWDCPLLYLITRGM